MDEPIEELGAAYRAYRPLLLGALAALARRGMVVPFDEALGLVHDFFIDGYPLVRGRYDPKLAKFTTYLYAAFTRYARPRIIRLGRMREALVGDDRVERAVGATDLDPASELDRRVLGDAFSQLSRDDRSLLLKRFSEGLSERSIAERDGATRHATRQRLLAALGRLVVALGDRSLVHPDELAVARAMWAEDRSLGETASLLGKTPEQVRRLASRVLAELARGLQV